MNLEMTLFPMSQRDQGHPSLCGSSPSLTSCLMPHQEVLWSQLIFPSDYSLLPLRNKLDHHMFNQAILILIHKHLWLMMEHQLPSPMTRMTLLGPPRQSQEKLMVSIDRLKQHTEEQSDDQLKMTRV